MNIQDEIAKTKQRLMELEEMMKKENWKPCWDDKYYIPVPTNAGFQSFSLWRGNENEISLKDAGMVFYTKEEAIEVGKRMYFRQWFESMSDADDWNGEEYWSAFWFYQKDSIDVWNTTYKVAGGIYFSTKEKCIEAIDVIGEDNFIKYVLGIKNYEKKKNDFF
jgi:hypothetical protein